MIEIRKLTKYFDKTCAVNDISLEIPDGIMFGLLGTNGAGKTTLLRMLTGILEADSGEIRIDDNVCGNVADGGLTRRGAGDFSPSCKEELFYLPDDPYYFPSASMHVMLDFFKKQYPKTELDSAAYLAEKLNLDMNQPIRTFSKGMKRQAFLIMALCSRTKYLFCDEVFDGLDPIVTEIMKNLFRQEMKNRDFTIIVASHKLTDLEDICGSIAILHKGGVVTAGDFRNRTKNVRKFQCVFPLETKLEVLKSHPGMISFHEDARFITLITKGSPEETRNLLEAQKPIFINEVPLSLEETFIAEMEATGYDIRKVLS